MFLVCSLQAQQVFSSSFGSGYGSVGSLHYTIGQCFYSLGSGSEGKVIQGIQLPLECIVLGVENSPASRPNVFVFPNPTLDKLHLRVIGDTHGLSYGIFDLDGRLRMSGRVSGQELDLSMLTLGRGVYLLRIWKDIPVLGQFKIIKM